MSTDSRYHPVRPMYALKQDYHLKKSLTYGFSQVSDQIREELICRGMSERQATVVAPQYLEGAISAFTGQIDFRQIHLALRAQAYHPKPQSDQGDDDRISPCLT